MLILISNLIQRFINYRSNYGVHSNHKVSGWSFFFCMCVCVFVLIGFLFVDMDALELSVDQAGLKLPLFMSPKCWD